MVCQLDIPGVFKMALNCCVGQRNYSVSVNAAD
jgi:hypothetical protein